MHGGAAGQLEYVIGRSDSKGGDEDTENYRDMRGEAKQAHLDRMAELAARGESKGATAEDEVDTEAAVVTDEAEEKVPESDRKDFPDNSSGVSSQAQERNDRYRLLGALPSLAPRANEEDVKVALALELPSDPKRAAMEAEASKKSKNGGAGEAPVSSGA